MVDITKEFKLICKSIPTYRNNVYPRLDHRGKI